MIENILLETLQTEIAHNSLDTAAVSDAYSLCYEV